MIKPSTRGDNMKTTTIQIKDTFNGAKTWVIKRSKCGHYSWEQLIHGRRFYHRFSRERVGFMSDVLGIEVRSLFR